MNCFNVNKCLTFFVVLLYPFLLFSQGVVFSESSGVKSGPFYLTLSTEDPNREIYYTTDGKTPTINAQRYTSPIPIFENTQVQAISSVNGVFDDFVSKAGYTYLSDEVKAFTSSVPVLVIDNLGQGALPQPPANVFTGMDEPVFVDKHFSVATLFEPVDGQTSLTRNKTLSINSGIKIRGSSSSQFPKKSFGFDSWDTQCQETDIEPLGLAKSADWVIFGSRLYDPTYIRSVLPYTLSRQMGRWASDSKPVEVFLNLDGGEVTMDDYLGIYFFMEKIGRGKDKVDIEKLDPDIQVTDPEISGGYIIKVDRKDYGAEGFQTIHTPQQYSYTNIYYPKERTMPDYQKPWIKDYIAQFENALQQIPNNRSYTEYFDVPACIDHWLLKAIPADYDAFILSEFMHKKRDGKIEMGPVWDLDRSAGSLDTRGYDPETWMGPASEPAFPGMPVQEFAAPVNWFEYGWYGYLFNDPEFEQAMKDRWFELREKVFSFENIDHVVDSITSVMREPMSRDVELWPIDSAYGNTFQGAIDFLKDWYHKRFLWVDQQWGFPPVFVSGGSEIKGLSMKINSGFIVSIQPNNSQGTIYYTTDGSDPRQEGGAISGNAQQYNYGISISNTTTVMARIYNNNEWSPLRKMIFYIDQDLSKLKITEIFYNPADNSELEFIELKNTGSSELNLTGVSFTDGIDFSFPINATVAANGFIVLAENADAFHFLNGFAPSFQYEGKLSNSGERVQLLDMFGNIITEVKYSDEQPWPQIADGLGYSLVPVSANPSANQDDPVLWRASSVIGGSPFEDDYLDEIYPVLITEVLANSADPLTDAIEIYNPNNSSVDISGWLLNDALSNEGAWAIPRGTVIGANEYMVFFEADTVVNGLPVVGDGNFGSAFSLGSGGDDVYILSASNGSLTGYSYGFELNPTLENVSYGEYANSAGYVDVVGFAESTFGTENSDPKIGPVVITQIMYNPAIPEDYPPVCDFIQIKNISDAMVNLYDDENIENTWKINGIGFKFPVGVKLQAGETAYVIDGSLSVDAFKERFAIVSDSKIFVFAGNLDNGGESISIQQPLAPVDNNGIVEIPYAAVDKVRYNNKSPWPDADGNGKMLQKKQDVLYGNDPNNWEAVNGSGNAPKFYTFTVNNGAGSGSYAAGSLVAVVADNPQDKAFYKWSGSGAEYLGNIYMRKNIVSIPSQNISLQVEYVDAQTERLIVSGDQWKYDNSATDLGTQWLAEGYNDSGWQVGSTSIGSANASTIINVPSSGGGGMWGMVTYANTTYYRKSISITESQNIVESLFRLKCKDGAVVYVNGIEVFRLHMKGGTPLFADMAVEAGENPQFSDYQISGLPFKEGENIIQVEVHTYVNSGMMVYPAPIPEFLFDFELSVKKAVIPNDYRTQIVSLNKGWNLVTLYVTPNVSSIEGLFPNVQILKNDNSFYAKNQPYFFNTITDLQAGDAFLIHNAVNEQISIEGMLYKARHTYELHKGWNLAGVPIDENRPIDNLETVYLQIKDMDSFYEYNNPNGQLTQMKRGKAYFINVSENTILTFNE